MNTMAFFTIVESSDVVNTMVLAGKALWTPWLRCVMKRER